tara:strand:- start:195 stop:812 length:618 start_codon:yes stop_codon:yes gene_type:complete
MFKENKYTEAMEDYASGGFEEEITAENFVFPEEEDYVDFGEEVEEWDVAADRPGLWENIRKKKQKEGKKYKPAKPGDPDRPDPKSWKKAQEKMSKEQKDALDKNKDGKVSKEDFELLRKDKKSDAAEYQGRKVKLGKPFLTPDGPKKRSVYVKNEKGNVVKVNFGDPNMKIKKNDPERRKSFRARHNCDNPGPRWKARYWSCKAW